jgi:4-amino-4-deoxy-L-arabinose transferase-like glycosyltransferase
MAQVLECADLTLKSPFLHRVGSWLALLWSHVLFPGEPLAPESSRWQSWLLLLLLPGILIYGCLSFPLFEPDEGRYAEIAREMLVRGEWTVPYLQGEPYLDKPPLLYWLVMSSYQAFGMDSGSARLVPAFAVHLTILLLYGFGRRILGERAAFWGALLLGLAPGFVSIGRLLILDGLLTLWITLSLFAGYEALRSGRLRWPWWLLAAAASGLGILTKGPVAGVLLVAPLWLQRRLVAGTAALSWRAVLAFLLIIAAVALPWYVAICLRLPHFAGYFLWHHNIERFVAPFDHLKPIWFYAPVLLAGLLPGTLLLVPFLRFLFSSHPETRSQRNPALGYTLLAGGWCVLFFSLSGCKLPTYVMPAFPPLALALGYYLASSSWGRSVWPKTVASLAFGIIGLGHNVVLPWYAGYRAPAGRLAELKNYCEDRQTPLICYPRNCDSLAFYVARDDLRCYRSKEVNQLIVNLQRQRRTILILTHRHSLQFLSYALPPELRVVEQRHFGLSPLGGLPEALAQNLTWIMGETSLGLCDLAVIENRKPVQPSSN